MCGINGVYGLNDMHNSEGLVDLMNKALSHRGPDDHGIYVNNHIALGQTRLSIIDLSNAGHQPMASGDKNYHITFNGEIYNYRKLKEKLDYPFTSQTDTEVLLAAYQKWGKECVHHLEGMFAFAIWDEAKKELFIARDRLGIKPLYYYYQKSYFIFASEIRALLKTGLIPRKLNQESLVDYLRYQTVHAPNTLINDVYMLLPGHFLTVKNEGIHMEKYWDIIQKSSIQGKYKKYEDILKDVNSLLKSAVEKRLVADVPFGAFLSGGIDSSIVVGLMSEIATQKVNTFSVTFKEAEFDEGKYAKIVAERFKTNHHEICLSTDYFLEELPNALKAMDHPSGDGPNTFVVSKVTKAAGITMALSGLGGDELFAGYDIFKRSLQLEKQKWLSAFPKGLKTSGGDILKKIKPSIASDKIAEFLKLNQWNLQETYPLSRQMLLDHDVKLLINKEFLPDNKVYDILTKHQLSLNGDSNSKKLTSISFAEIGTYMQNVLLRDTDQMSMAHALEVRVPFLDHELVEYVLSIPDQFKYPHSPKKLLVDSVKGLIPDSIVNRAKMGFVLPWNVWLKNELRAFCEQKLLNLSERSLFNRSKVEEIWSDFLKNNPKTTWSRIWYLVVLENWLEEHEVEL